MPNDNTHTLLPCPNPHCERKELRKGASYMQNWRIECGSCGLSGPRAGTYDLAVERWNDFVAAMNTRTPAEPKAGDWEKAADQLHDAIGLLKLGDHPDKVFGEYVFPLFRALSSAAPRITEEMVERVLDGIRVRGNTDRHHGIRTGIEKAKLAMIALLRQQGQPPFTPTSHQVTSEATQTD